MPTYLLVVASTSARQAALIVFGDKPFAPEPQRPGETAETSDDVRVLLVGQDNIWDLPRTALVMANNYLEGCDKLSS
jgi:hypothetical protein